MRWLLLIVLAPELVVASWVAAAGLVALALGVARRLTSHNTPT